MLEMFVANPIVRRVALAALAGWVAAAAVDLHSFMRWKSINEAATYDYQTMLLRWSQGLIGGALTGAGSTMFV